MSDHTDPPSSSLPAGWQADESSEDLPQWLNDDLAMIVSVSDISCSEYLVLVEQYLSGNGWTSRVSTHGASFTDMADAESRAHDWMHEASEGQHVLECLCAVEHEDAIDFICHYRDELPDSISREELTAFVRASLYDDDADDLEQEADDLAGDDHIQIDIFPRPLTHVVRSANLEMGEATTAADRDELQPHLERDTE